MIIPINQHKVEHEDKLLADLYESEAGKLLRMGDKLPEPSQLLNISRGKYKLLNNIGGVTG
jgi:hypothetical protein